MSYKDKVRRAEYRREIRKKNRDWLNAYKVEQGCKSCGYNQHPCALDFDHRDPSTKSFTIASVGKHWRNLKTVQEEVAKCDVLCANCHRVKHYGEEGKWRATRLSTEG